MASLPFNLRGEIQAQGGAVLASDVPVAIWPTFGENSGTGRSYDHRGQMPRDYASHFDAPNRSLVVDGVTYSVIDAVANDFFPHLALSLRRVVAGG